MLDGELFVAIGDRLEFERLQERIHPADSRVRMLAETTPAGFVAFDLLALGDESLMGEPFEVRRARLEEALADVVPPIHLTRTTSDPDEANEWFSRFEGAGLDGVVAKPLGATYQPNARTMLKIKHERTADVVVAGYRLHKTSTPEQPLLGSLLLGLYADGKLQHIGVSASFTAKRRAELSRSCSRWCARTCPSTPGASGSEWAIAQPRPGARHPEPLERRARTSRSRRCAPSACSRSATTTWRAAGSGTPPSSSAGAPTATPSRAATSSSRSRSATTWPRCWAARPIVPTGLALGP